MRHMTRSQCAKVGGGAYWGSSARKDRWTGHAEKVGGGAFWGSNARKDRWTGHADARAAEGRWIKHVEQASDSGRRRSRRVASPIGHCARATNSLGDGSIMVLGDQRFVLSCSWEHKE
jgi:hypothetical protein